MAKVFPDPFEPGTGLRMVAGIVERAGGSLLFRRRAPHPRVALLIPRASDYPVAAQTERSRL